MLEAGDHLRCWALANWPSPSGEQWAEALGNHRLAYLEYEGPVSGNRGDVQRQEEGEYELLVDTPNEVAVRLSGKRLTGRLTLRRETNDDSRWKVSFEPAY